jgi:hypothetical protein
MYLYQILLPICDKAGHRFARGDFEKVERELIACFDGFTAYSRAPASGLWKDSEEESVERDDLIVYEAIADEQDLDWWRGFRERLERLFKQDRILIRSQVVEII